MDYPERGLTYRNNELHFDNVPLKSFAAQRRTPFYLYSLKKVKEAYREFEQALAIFPHSTICYALKANPHPQILACLSELGAGADIVSGGELERAREANISADKIVFSGVGKTREELKEALKQGILSFNVESLDELDELTILAQAHNTRARVCLRFNPAVKPDTHRGISTGESGHKFGLEEQEIKAIYQQWGPQRKGIHLQGLAMHIGSQLTSMDATLEALKKILELAKEAPTALEILDLGGGLGIDYLPEQNRMIRPAEYAQALKALIGDQREKTRLIFEPGRFLVARAGILITQCLRQKPSGGRTFSILDSGMTDLLRPALYQAYHHLIPLEQTDREQHYTFAGPICETTDVFATDRMAGVHAKGDYLAILDAGAYGASMSSTYNLRPLTEEWILKDE